TIFPVVIAAEQPRAKLLCARLLFGRELALPRDGGGHGGRRHTWSRDRVHRGVAELSLTVRASAHSQLRDLHDGNEPRRRATRAAGGGGACAPLRAWLHARLSRFRRDGDGARSPVVLAASVDCARGRRAGDPLRTVLAGRL